jgi:hypothetical protein
LINVISSVQHGGIVRLFVHGREEAKDVDSATIDRTERLVGRQ